MAEQILRMEHITKIYPNGFAANKDVTFCCEKGTIHALLGENGAGKTTLMKVLFGFLSLDSGKIVVKGEEVVFRDSLDAIRHGVGMVHQHFMLVSEITVAENVVLGMEPVKWGLFNMDAAVRVTADIAAKYRFEMDPRAIVGDCSVGIKQKIEILKALLRGADILILDEPTAVLTPQEIVELFEELKKLRDMGHTIVFISHKLNEVKALCDDFTVLRQGRVVATGKVADHSEKELSSLMVGRSVEPVISVGCTREKAKEVLRVDNLSYTNFAGKKLLQNVTFSMCQGEILGVAGVEGNGQKELSEVMTGLRRFKYGDILMNGASIKDKTVRQIRQMGIGNISEDRMIYGCAPMMSVWENIIADRYYTGKYSKGILLNGKAIQKDMAELACRYDVVCPNPESLAGVLSGGNIQKMIVAREFSGENAVIIADQPTRGIDVGSSMFIHEQLLAMTREKNASVLLVSADLSELLRLSDSLIVMFGGEIAAYFESTVGLTELELGEYMLGVQRMDADRIRRADYEAR